MMCPVCKKEGRTSRVTPGACFKTLIGWSPGYYDESGRYVSNPDPNWRTTEYACSNGHRFDVVSKEGEPDRVRVAGAGAGPCYDASEDGEFRAAHPDGGSRNE